MRIRTGVDSGFRRRCRRLRAPRQNQHQQKQRRRVREERQRDHRGGQGRWLPVRYSVPLRCGRSSTYPLTPPMVRPATM